VILQQILGSRGSFAYFSSPSEWLQPGGLKGKVSALSRGMSGMISILIDYSNFYPDSSNLNLKFKY
jgi:hypothetical protein